MRLVLRRPKLLLSTRRNNLECDVESYVLVARPILLKFMGYINEKDTHSGWDDDWQARRARFELNSDRCLDSGVMLVVLDDKIVKRIVVNALRLTGKPKCGKRIWRTG